MTAYRGPSIEKFDPLELAGRKELRFVWYQTLWSLAAHYANGIPEDGDEERRRKARASAAALARSAHMTLRILDRSAGRSPKPIVIGRVKRRLAIFLRDTIEPSAIALVAAMSKSVERKESTAASFSDLLALMQTDDERGWTAAQALVELYVLPKTWSPRAHYNLACYLAARPGREGEAIEQLEKTFDPLRSMPAELYLLADWAWEDGSMERLRADSRFGDLTAPYRTSLEVEAWANDQKA